MYYDFRNPILQAYEHTFSRERKIRYSEAGENRPREKIILDTYLKLGHKDIQYWKFNDHHSEL